MNEIEVFTSNNVQRHNFDRYKNKLKNFSEQLPEQIKIDKVETEGFIWFTDHKVTGSELNKVTSGIQENLILLMNGQNKIIKEFNDVYNAFETLDKDYISGILSALKSSEKAHQSLQNQVELQEEFVEKVISKNKELNEEVYALNVKLDQIDAFVDSTTVVHKSLQEQIIAQRNFLEDIVVENKNLKELVNILNSKIERLENKDFDLKKVNVISYIAIGIGFINLILIFMGRV